MLRETKINFLGTVVSIQFSFENSSKLKLNITG